MDDAGRDETFMREKVAYVMQEELLFPFLSVEETLTLHCRLRRARLTEAEVAASVAEIVAELGLGEGAARVRWGGRADCLEE